MGAIPLRTLSEALRRSLAEWFSVGLLQLRRISWQTSSAALLEKARPMLPLSPSARVPALLLAGHPPVQPLHLALLGLIVACRLRLARQCMS